MATLPRPFVLLVAALASLLAVACGDAERSLSIDTREEAPPPGEPPPAGVEDVERQMERMVFELVNDERRERGLEPLAWDDRLAELAREWSRRMAEEGALEHQDAERMLERVPDGFTGVGENIFRGTGPVAASTIHVGWMRSEGHRANVLRPAFDRLGVGVVCTEDGEIYATQRFARAGAPATGPPDQEVPPEEPVVAEEGRGPSCPTG